MIHEEKSAIIFQRYNSSRIIHGYPELRMKMDM